MQFHRTVLRAANGLFNLIVILLLIVGGSYSAYALWDNERIYAAAGDVQPDMIKNKPEIQVSEESGLTSADFSSLLSINPDVVAWLTMDGTEIDYPVLQGDNNFSYINTDVYGNFALAGSIFLDSRNSSSFTDTYSLLYGHHMDNRKMFGDLDLYKDEQFYNENTTGTLILPDSAYNLEIFSVMLVGASEDNIFDPTQWTAYNISRFYNFVKTNSLYYDEAFVNAMIKNPETSPRILCLSTCASEYTDARTIVLAKMIPYSSEETGGQQE